MQIPSSYRRVLQVALWSVLWLALMDVALNQVRMPSVARYFNFGRSIEGKLVEAIGAQADQPNAVVQAGWIDPAQWQRTLPAEPQPGADMLVAVYGQSFAFNAVEAMAALDGHMTPRLIGGPAAPVSHSYAAYRADAPLRHADVVVVGILASSLAKAGSISGLSWTFESPAPFTFPKFTLQGGTLSETPPLLHTEQAFREAFAARGDTWRAFKDQLRAQDQGFDRFAFEDSVLDRSALVRLVRRGWVASEQHYRLDDAGPGSDPGGQLAVTRALLQRIRQQAADKGERLVVALFQDRGAEVSLLQELGPTLEALGVSYVSSERLFSSRDPANFIADGHFSEQANGLIAQALLDVVRQQPHWATLSVPSTSVNGRE